MVKRAKIEKKRTDRRERARLREQGLLPEDVAAEPSNGEASASEPSAHEASDSGASTKKAKTPKVEEKEPGLWEKMNEFFREVGIERRKINWPSTDEAWRSTWVVITTIVFIAIFMGITSVAFNKITNVMFGLPDTPLVSAPAQPAPTSPTPPEPAPVEQPKSDEKAGLLTPE